jgi:hypothetical protein
MNSKKTLLIESVCEGMRFKDRIIVEETYHEFAAINRMIVEANLTQDQVQQIFKAVADGAAAGGNVEAGGAADPASNRTVLGKTSDAVGKVTGAVSNAWNNVKTKIAQSVPVSGFDVAVDKLQSQLLAKAGGDKGTVGKILSSYKEFGKNHPIMQGAIIAGLTAIAAMSLGTGAVGTAGIAFGLRTFDKLLSGDRASSALWKGAKAAALGYLGHQAAGKLA